MVLKTFLRFSLSVAFFLLLFQTTFAQRPPPTLDPDRAASPASSSTIHAKDTAFANRITSWMRCAAVLPGSTAT